MSAAVTTTTPRLRDLRVMGWMLTEIARRWPELIDSAIALAEREYSETFVDGFKELAAIDRFHTLRLVAFMAVCHAVDRGEREWLPGTLAWMGRLKAEPKRPMPPLPPELRNPNGRVPSLSEGAAFVLSALVGLEFVDARPLRRDVEAILERELARCAS